jgi:hypothetical protein
MPNTSVPAAGGAMPTAKFDRAAIMQAAWASYRGWHARQESIHGPRAFNRAEFAFRLQIAWRDAKRAAMTANDRRCDEIRTQIEFLKFKSGAINIEPIRRKLESQLSAVPA